MDNLNGRVENIHKAVNKIFRDHKTLHGNSNRGSNFLVDKLFGTLNKVNHPDDDGFVWKKVRVDESESENDSDDAESEEEETEEEDHESNFTLSVEENALGNPMLVKEILEYLDTYKLKTCRLVNSFWNDLSTGILIKRKCLELSIRYDPKYNSCYLTSETDNSTNTLKYINTQLEKSLGFPCTNLIIKGQLVMDQDLMTFLSKWGSKIYHLEWQNRTEDDKKTTRKELNKLRQILVEYLPTFGSLCIHDISSLDSVLEPGSFESINLDNLKTVRFYHHESGLKIFREIVVAAVNLQEVYLGHGMNYFPHASVLVEMNRPHLVKEICSTITHDNVGMYERVANSTPPIQLEDFHIDIDDRPLENGSRISKALMKIFKSSSTSMKTLKVGAQLWNELPKFVIPSLQNVTELELEWISCQETDGPPMIPKNLSFSFSFPALRRLSLEFDRVSDFHANYNNNLSPFVDIIPTVEDFELCGLRRNDWLVNFSQVFPNLKELTLRCVCDLPVVTKLIWIHYKGIVKLVLEVHDVEEEQHSYSSLDPLFTGFSERTCRKLKKNVDSVRHVEKRRVNPSIVDLKSLTEFQLELVGDPDPDDTDFDASQYLKNNSITHVSGQFAFALMPQLKVKVIGENFIEKDFRDAFASLTPYAEIETDDSE